MCNLAVTPPNQHTPRSRHSLFCPRAHAWGGGVGGGLKGRLNERAARHPQFKVRPLGAQVC
jgi:hypothetical protein